MKISLNSISALNEQYNCSENLLANGSSELAKKIGAQLGAIEEVTELGPKYQGIVISKVMSCVDHPDADRLHVCKIDDGGVVKDVERDKDGYVQVVCGAPNVREGLLVAWLPPGSTVPSSFGSEPFVIEARELRGVISNGMLSSPKELSLGDSHDGILEIDGDHKPGTDFAEAFHLSDEVVIDIENKMFTHRPDCFGILGVARELAGIQGLAFKSPDWYITNPEFPKPEADLPLIIKNEVPDLVPRFTAITLAAVKVGPSPVWLQVFLAKIGQKSINNIVDYTNFNMLLTGQPLHAYDYDKVSALSGVNATIVIRNPKAGEKIKLLNGKEIEPRTEAIMIATDKQLIGIGGVMGGSDTEVDANTTNIIIESATFDMYSIRRTSMTHGLFTDAVTRFSKGQSPLQNLAVLAKIVGELQHIAGGKIAGPVIDDNHSTITQPLPTIAASFINERLGLTLSKEQIKTLLENVEFSVTFDNDNLIITAPFWRTDIEIAEDIVEEVGRLYGYGKLPLTLPLRTVKPAEKDTLLEFKSKVRNTLSNAGANEVLTYSFVHGNLLERTGQNLEEAYKLSNALSLELQFYRMTLAPSLLNNIHANIKAGYDEFAIFEIGKGHSLANSDSDGLPKEDEIVALVYTAHEKLNKSGAAYFQAKKFLTELASSLGINLAFAARTESGSSAYEAPYETSRSAFVSDADSGVFIGIIGEFTSDVRKHLKLSKHTAGFEIDLTVLQKVTGTKAKYLPLSRFPKVEQDICLKLPAEATYQVIRDFVVAEIEACRPAQTFTSVTPVDIYRREDDANHTQFTFRLAISSYEKTMTDVEVNSLLDTVAAAAKPKLGAERI